VSFSTILCAIIALLVLYLPQVITRINKEEDDSRDDNSKGEMHFSMIRSFWQYNLIRRGDFHGRFEDIICLLQCIL
jgi:hypothetical protein